MEITCSENVNWYLLKGVLYPRSLSIFLLESNNSRNPRAQHLLGGNDFLGHSAAPELINWSLIHKKGPGFGCVITVALADGFKLTYLLPWRETESSLNSDFLAL